MNRILSPEPVLTVFPYHASFKYEGTTCYPAGVTYRGNKLPPVVKGEADRFEVHANFSDITATGCVASMRHATRILKLPVMVCPLSGSGMRSPILFRVIFVREADDWKIRMAYAN
jgi:hypothetical protein